MSSRLRLTLAFLTVAVDSAATAVAFFLSYRLREAIPFPTPLRLGPFRDYLGLLVLYVVSMVLVFFLYRLYHPRRGQSRVDLFYSLLSAVSIGVIVSTSLSYLVTQGEALLTRGAIIYSLFFTIALVGLGRALMGRVECALRTRHPEHLLLVGTGEVARMILQKTVQSPQLGYRVIGFVDGQSDLQEVAGLPVFGGEMVLHWRGARLLAAVADLATDVAVDVVPAVGAEDARRRAVEMVAKYAGLPPEGVEATEPALWLYDPRLVGAPGPQDIRLVWRMSVRGVASLHVNELVLVDAHTGAIALHFTQADIGHSAPSVNHVRSTIRPRDSSPDPY